MSGGNLYSRILVLEVWPFRCRLLIYPHFLTKKSCPRWCFVPNRGSLINCTPTTSGKLKRSSTSAVCLTFLFIFQIPQRSFSEAYISRMFSKSSQVDCREATRKLLRCVLIVDGVQQHSTALAWIRPQQCRLLKEFRLHASVERVQPGRTNQHRLRRTMFEQRNDADFNLGQLMTSQMKP